MAPSGGVQCHQDLLAVVRARGYEDGPASCASCGRTVCRTDLGGDTRCATCRSLKPDPDPEDRLIDAVLHANRGEPPKAKAWQTARDGSHTVVELDLGWTRKLVVVVRHGESRAEVGFRRAVWGKEKLN